MRRDKRLSCDTNELHDDKLTWVSLDTTLLVV